MDHKGSSSKLEGAGPESGSFIGADSAGGDHRKPIIEHSGTEGAGPGERLESTVLSAKHVA